MATKPPRFQGPKGTRDFYPAEMAWRRYLEEAWRRVSIRHGFTEIEGPTFEPLGLYTVKSGDGIVSELFSFQDRGGRDLALRPEFTPTLARMYADRAASLSKPTKWFAIPLHYRAERPQRGRLREFIQWNIDVIGWDFEGSRMNKWQVSVEPLAVMVDLFRELGLTSKDIRIKMQLRDHVEEKLLGFGVSTEALEDSLILMDARLKLPPEEYQKRARELGWSVDCIENFDRHEVVRLDTDPEEIHFPSEQAREDHRRKFDTPGDLYYELKKANLLEWCEFDSWVVRGLAYYTGFVFEAHEASGTERAVAGGGRYDNLIEMFGGPSTPAVGFGMGDVVLSLVLKDRGLMPEGVELAEKLGARPDVFVFCVGDELCDAETVPLVTEFRSAGLHTRRSYKTSKNVGKLLKDAVNCGARYAVILGGDAAESRNAIVKDLTTGESVDVLFNELTAWLVSRCS